MKKFLMIILLLGIVPMVVADCCETTCNTNSNCNACCVSDVSCCENAQAFCEPNGCCAEADDDDCCSCHCLVSAHTFMNVRPQFQGASPEKISLWRYERMYAREDGKHGAFQIVPFGGRSTEASRMATYFMPFCKSTLVVAESSADDVARDIDATAFGIFSVDGNFQSNISFRPRQSVAGVGLSWRQRLSRNEEPKGFWFEASMPIEHVRNSVNLCETVINSGGGVIDADEVSNAQPNMTTAFQQASFLFGRVPCDCDGDGGMSKTGIADLDLRIGYGWKNEGICHLESYIGVLVPTGNKVKGCNIFEPILGHNHHVGFEFGNAMGFRIWSNEEKEREIWMETSIHSIYLNSNWERRSFDVKYKPWSRYLPVYTSFAQAQAAANNTPTGTGNVNYTPGINVFTQDLKIQGRFQRTLNSALRYQSAHFVAEGGFNFFAQDAECAQLCNWCGTVAFLDCRAQQPNNPASTAINPYLGVPTRYRTITNCNFGCNTSTFSEDTYNAAVITQSDLDFASAAAPAQMLYTFYGTLGYRWDNIEYPVLLTLGGSYEFASDNSGLDRWLIWGKIGMSY